MELYKETINFNKEINSEMLQDTDFSTAHLLFG